MITLKEFQKAKKENPLLYIHGISDKHEIASVMPTAYNIRHTIGGFEVKTIEAVFGSQDLFRAEDCFLTEKEATDELVRRLEAYIKVLKKRGKE